MLDNSEMASTKHQPSITT